jgi:nicotinate-nucleotide adenylyltransferase
MKTWNKPLRAKSPRTPKRIGIFGGSFDPPHVGHLIVAHSALEQARLDKVVFVPAYFPPHKLGNKQTSAAARLAMAKLAVKGNSKFLVSDLEVKRKGISYTVDTLRWFKSRFENAELFFIIGGDSLSQFSTWKDPEEILNLAQLVVYPRPLQSLAEIPVALPRAQVLRGPMIEISSSDVRLKVSHGESIRYLVPDEVVRFVKKHKLYARS